MDNLYGVDISALSKEEQDTVIRILEEISDSGSSKILENLKYAEYKEKPVDIITFIKDPLYLGKAWHLSDGTCKLFPFWENKLKELFPDELTTNFNTFIESGARGLGKSEIAVTCGLYLMHRLMCLKDPHLTLNLKPTEKVCFAFMNITEELAYDIGVNKFQHTVQSSDWFLSRGTLSGRKDILWNPPSWIDIIVGSQPRHVIGQPIYYCLSADTQIITSEGIQRISELVDKPIRVLSQKENGTLCYSDICTVKPTKVTNVWYEIETEDNTIIKCTPEHRLLLTNGEYKEAKDLTCYDELVDLKPFGYIYKFTNLTNNKIYIGKRERSTFDESYYGSGKLWWEDIRDLDKSLIKREIIAWGLNRKELNELEKFFIAKFSSQDPSIGYNIHKGGQGGNSLNDPVTWSLMHKGEHNGRYGKPVSQETRDKISKANKGKNRSAETRQKISNSTKGVPKPAGFGAKVSAAIKGKSHNLSEKGLQALRESNKVHFKGTHVYNNGQKEIRIKNNQPVPQGYIKGRLIKGIPTGKNNVAGRKWYNNGTIELYLLDDPPQGFSRGRLKGVTKKHENKKDT